MLFSREWLGEYVDLPASVDELADRLTAAGHAVEGRETITLDGAEDCVLEIDVTTNRPDCMCHLGMAREVATILGRELRRPHGSYEESEERAADAVRLEIEDPAGCPRYLAMVIRDVTVGPSPDWLRRRLESIGLRAINNVVDVTNYVLWETGQPLHAFDLDRLRGGMIGVRRGREGESLVTLDDHTRRLDPDVLVITDGEGPVALAGIMGGADSEVGDKTRHILLESAHFDPRTVRAGARKLGMKTDASHRFERGADPEGPLYAARRAAAMLAEIAGGRVLGGHVEAATLPAGWPPRLDLELARLQAFAGVELTAAEVERILGALGFELAPAGPGRWRVTVPSWRWYDFAEAYPADLYEEVLRVVGFDRIPAALPAVAGVDAPPRPLHRLRRRLQDQLAACGFSEAIDFAFHDRESDAAYPSVLGDSRPLALANPLSERYAVMRRSLLPNLVASAGHNVRRGAEVVRLFEIGHVFAAAEDGAPHLEREALALVAGGRRGLPWERRSEIDFYDLKGVVESLAQHAGARLETRPATLPRFVPDAAASLHDGEGRRIGFCGQLDLADAPYPIFAAELDVEPWAELAAELRIVAPSKYPGVAVDTTLTHPLEVAWQAIAAAIAAAEVADLVAWGLKDRYRGAGVPEGAVNTTIHFLYNSEERSLTQEEVNDRHTRLVARLEERFGSGDADEEGSAG